MPRRANIHNLSGNAKEDSPHELIVIDTETVPLIDGDEEIHRLRVWCAKLVRRHDRNPSRPRTVRARGTTVEQLLNWLDSQIKTDPPVWVYTHNLSFDLGVTRLPLALMHRGWTLGQHNLASEAPWANLRRGGRSLKLCDSHSVFPYSAEHIGNLVGIDKPALPQWEDSDDAWYQRCDADVDIIMQALLQAMDWWDENKLGHWSTTGPRTGWNAMRHRCVRGKGQPQIDYRGPGEGMWIQHGDGHVVINPDPDARAFERDALYQGRREVWRTGELPPGAYAELDFRHAYLSVASELRLPCRRGLVFESLPVDTPYLDHDNVGIIADVVVSARVPRYPYRARFGILYPTGTFRTTMAGPEIAEARSRGELVSIGKGYFYRLSYHMQPWALWLQGILDGDTEAAPPGAKLMVKAHSRTVFGKWAARTSHVIAEGTTPVTGWLAEHAIDTQTGGPATILHMAGQWSLIRRDLEADDSFPAVLAWVQSHVRLGLNAILDQLPDRSIVSCSTDSALVNLLELYDWDTAQRQHFDTGRVIGRMAGGLCAALRPFIFPFELAVKGLYTQVAVLSPQHLKLDGALRLAGVNKDATEVRPGVYEFRTWPALGRQIALDEPRGFVRERRRVDLGGLTVNRWAAVDGCTAPPGARLDQDSQTVLLGPPVGGCAAHGAPWAERQWPSLPRM